MEQPQEQQQQSNPEQQPQQVFMMPDPSMGAMPVSDAQLMMPFMLANGGAQASAQPNGGISAEDIALYDRQIRLWGVAAQAKIQSANILLITIKALANEIAKNLVLAGVGSLTILDGAVVTEADLGAQFFLADGGDSLIGQNRAHAAAPAIQKLNPRVRVHVDAEGVKSKGPSYFAGFDVVIATDLDPDSFNLINTATRLNYKSFYAASTHGMYGFIFSDLIEHDFVIEREVGNMGPTKPGTRESRTRSVVDVKTSKNATNKTIESVTKRELYSTWFLASDVAVLPDDYTKSRRRLRAVSPALSCLRALWEFMHLQGGRVPSNRDDLKLFTQIATLKHKALSLPSESLTPEFLRSFLQNLGSEIAPVTAILGGQLAQDVINVLSQKEQPIQNMVIFDGNSMEALMFPLHPEGSLVCRPTALAGI
ncbi:DNA damage tolerance protein-like protein [Hapsidospora chrysogenum ATCC 11550]|uniref:Ubiquitin-like 1-activating enzyme E1A n=1 Tax=Hapsidospora chrysogenum (strain ATCC 11550 / CBS 779.69 / DSM 880 / IAM 14645 / JCM 23072 / IMI 49137) TaxID=857340 RepID=A0A086T6E9_HAPC1|nr:DNA damage tolerance protein-like protein [Hapsidospora chrysogenum ATCC 11550]